VLYSFAMLCRGCNLLRWLKMLQLSLYALFQNGSAFQKLRKDWLCCVPDALDNNCHYSFVHGEEIS